MAKIVVHKTGNFPPSDSAELCFLCRNEASGEGVGAKMAKALDGKNYQLVITGHSLGAGTAALIGLKLKARFPGQSLNSITANWEGWQKVEIFSDAPAFHGD